MQRWSLVVTGLLAIALAFTMIRGCESTSVTSPAEVSDLVGPNPLEQARHDESALQRVPRSRLPTADDADTIERDSVRWRLRVTLVFAGARIDRPARVLVASEAWSGRAQDSAPTLIADAAGTCTVDLEYFRRLHVHERSDVRLQILVHAVGFAPYRAVGITLGDTSPAEPLLIEHEARLEAGSWLVARITDATDRPVPDALVFSHATTFPTSIDDREAAFAGFSDALGEVRVDTTGRRVLRLAAHHPDHGHGTAEWSAPGDPTTQAHPTRIMLQRKHVLSARLLFQDGTPLSSHPVRVQLDPTTEHDREANSSRLDRDSGFTSIRSRTREDGSIAWTGIASGAYRIIPEATIDDEAREIAESLPLVFTDAAETTLTVQLRRIRVRLATSETSPIRRARLTLSSSRSVPPRLSHSSRTAVAATTIEEPISFVSGDFDVHSLAVLLRPASWLYVECSSFRSRYGGRLLHFVEPAVMDDIRFVPFGVADLSAVVDFDLTTAAGQGPPDCKIAIDAYPAVGGRLFERLADVDGRPTFRTIAGAIAVTISPNGSSQMLLPQTTHHFVRAGASQTIKIEVASGGGIRFILRLPDRAIARELPGFELTLTSDASRTAPRRFSADRFGFLDEHGLSSTSSVRSATRYSVAGVFPAGAYTATFRAPTYRTVQVQVDIRVGEHSDLAVELLPR